MKLGCQIKFQELSFTISLLKKNTTVSVINLHLKTP